MSHVKAKRLPGSYSVHEKLKQTTGRRGVIGFAIVLLTGLIYIGVQIGYDLSQVRMESAWPYVLLGIALLVALGFEFVNGFHDTANAVATVIYTHSLDPNVAVIWSGCCNFLGVVTSTGIVAFSIVSLLPVELILQIGSSSGFAMVFALLLAAIMWNIGTWWFGLPASSSHTLIGSVIGVGIANQLMSPLTGTSGVDWNQAANIGQSLLLSPLFGFLIASLLFLTMKALVNDPRLYSAPRGDAPPPFWIRGLLIITCTGVSFFHGSNDGQKGMGLIMLILIGIVPTTYALNHTVTAKESQDFIAVSEQTSTVLAKYIPTGSVTADPRDDVMEYVRTRAFKPETMPALRSLINGIGTEIAMFKELKNVPQDRVRNFRNDMYLVSEALRMIRRAGKPELALADVNILENYKQHIDRATRFIPIWVKVAVALALGLGTMVGWKRIVITVGEKIGKHHLTYAQGAAAEITAMATIGAADGFGLPVSTTHVLSSGVAGTMLANRSGLQWLTVRNLLLAWVLTLPTAMVLSASLFWALRHLL